jgi:hypothetical protein
MVANLTEPGRAFSVALLVALLASITMLGPALAHAFEFANKIDLPRDQYFVVQQIYRGWDRFAAVLVLQVIALLSAAFLARHNQRVLRPILLAILLIAATQALFWTYTFPANQATSNWAVQPDNWETLRLHWEYSHLASSGLQFIAVTCLIVAALRRR